MKPRSIRLIIDTSILLILFVCIIGISLIYNNTELKGDSYKLADSFQNLIDSNIKIDESKTYNSRALGEIIEGTSSEIAARQQTAIKLALEKATQEEKNRIVYDNLTLQELTAKINKMFGNSYLKNKGELYASYSLEKGVDPYTAVAITMLETGCNAKCSNFTRNCNNVGGMKGSPSCQGTSYRAFNTLDEGIKSFINNLSNNYYKKGLDTPEKMNKKYAESSTWAIKVNKYIDRIKKI